MDFATYNNHETAATRAAKKNAEKIAARRKGLSVYTVAKVAAVAFAAAAAIRFFF